jgi:hypothetical protein
MSVSVSSTPLTLQPTGYNVGNNGTSKVTPTPGAPTNPPISVHPNTSSGN